MSEQSDDRLTKLRTLSLELNAAMPTDVMLKGDGSFWITTHGNDGGRPRKLTNEQVLKLLYSAVEFGSRMISV